MGGKVGESPVVIIINSIFVQWVNIWRGGRKEEQEKTVSINRILHIGYSFCYIVFNILHLPSISLEASMHQTKTSLRDKGTYVTHVVSTTGGLAAALRFPAPCSGRWQMLRLQNGSYFTFSCFERMRSCFVELSLFAELTTELLEAGLLWLWRRRVSHNEAGKIL